MKKIILLITAAMAVVLGMSACTNANNGSSSSNPLIGTWTGTESEGVTVTLTFTDATQGSGTATYGGSVVATIQISYAMKDATTGAGVAILTDTSEGYSEKVVESFTFTLMGNQLVVNTQSKGTIIFTKTGGSVTPGSSLVGTVWRYMEDAEEPDEYVQLSFDSASTGKALSYDGGRVRFNIDFTYTFITETTGSGLLYMPMSGEIQAVPFTFSLIGTSLYVRANMGETYTYSFVKVS